MVGDPKHLSDLARIDGAVLVRCRTCRLEQRWDRDELADVLRWRRGSTVWSELPRQMPCRCGSRDVRVVVLPYTKVERPAQNPCPPEIEGRVIAELGRDEGWEFTVHCGCGRCTFMGWGNFIRALGPTATVADARRRLRCRGCGRRLVLQVGRPWGEVRYPGGRHQRPPVPAAGAAPPSTCDSGA